MEVSHRWRRRVRAWTLRLGLAVSWPVVRGLALTRRHSRRLSSHYTHF